MTSRSSQRACACALFAVVVVATLTASAATAPALAPKPYPSAEVLARIEEFIVERMNAEPSAGLSVAFWLDGRVWAKGFGLRDVTHKLPATPDTSYRMASVTKPFTAVAAMQLVEEGKLDLDADVRRYVPYYPKKAHVVTTRQLLGHLAGVPNYKNCAKECFLQTHHDTRQSIAIFAGFPLEQAPGEKYLYSSYGYNLVGAAIEGASGLSYGDYLARHVFGRAGMARSRMDDPRASIPERAEGYRVVGKKLVPSDFVDISSRFAGGGTRSTVRDMVAFAEAYLDEKLVSRASMTLIERSMTTSEGVLTDYGLGLAVLPQSGRFVLAHGGGQPETSTLLVIYPAERFAVALAANVEGYHATLHDVKERIVADVLGDGGMRRTPIGDDDVSNVVARAASGLMSHGVAQYQRWGANLSDSPAAVIEAFARVRALFDEEQIARDPLAALEQARLGDDPKGGRAYAIAGAHMAGVVAHAQGAARLRAYHDDEPFAFVLDYDAACRALSCPDAFRLPGLMIERIGGYHDEWRRTNQRSVRELFVHKGSDPAAVRALLDEAFAGARVHPDLSFELVKAAEGARDDGARDRERALLALAHERHPCSPRALLAFAALAFEDGEVTKARALLSRWNALEDDPVDDRPAALVARAKALKKRSKAGALELLAAASELFPSSVELYDALAEAARDNGDHERARAALTAAETIAPSKKRARTLQQLTTH